MEKFNVSFVESCASTNDLARVLPPYSAVYTGRQTNGRGRSGRLWQDGQGNLMTSITLPKPKNPQHYSFIAALAVVQALSFLSPRIKWPNDIWVEGKKICGILLEATDDKLIIGIGVNILSAPSGQMMYPVGCLKDWGAEAEPRIILDNILQNLQDVIECYQQYGFTAVRNRWLEFATMLGQTINVRMPNQTLTGVFEGIDPDGALILRTNTQTRLITAGDIFKL